MNNERKLLKNQFSGRISTGNGVFSMAEAHAAHTLLNSVLSNLSGWDQGDEEAEHYYKADVKELVFALTGNKISDDILFKNNSEDDNDEDDDDFWGLVPWSDENSLKE